MICPDCAAAADHDAGSALDEHDLDDPEGHDRCVARNLGAVRGSADCACQHRTKAREVLGG